MKTKIILTISLVWWLSIVIPLLICLYYGVSNLITALVLLTLNSIIHASILTNKKTIYSFLFKKLK